MHMQPHARMKGCMCIDRLEEMSMQHDSAECESLLGLRKLRSNVAIRITSISVNLVEVILLFQMLERRKEHTMAGIEKIISSIKASAETKAAEIISEAEAKAADLLEKTRKECLVYSVEENAKSDKKIELAVKRYNAQSEQAAKLIFLNARQNMIESTITKALESLEKAPAEEYFGTLLKLIEKSAGKGDGELFVSEEDMKRMPADFAAEAAKIAASKGGTLKIAGTSGDIKSGFILKYGQIEENCTFKALFEENHDKLQDIVNSILWN